MHEYSCYFYNHSRIFILSGFSCGKNKGEAHKRFKELLRVVGALKPGEKYKIAVCSGDRPLDSYPDEITHYKKLEVEK